MFAVERARSLGAEARSGWRRRFI